MIWNLKDLIQHSKEHATQINGKWHPVRPINYKHRSLKQRLKEAIAVFRGKAECFLWQYQ